MYDLNIFVIGCVIIKFIITRNKKSVTRVVKYHVIFCGTCNRTMRSIANNTSRSFAIKFFAKMSKENEDIFYLIFEIYKIIKKSFIHLFKSIKHCVKILWKNP
jgi:ribosomal silencing factor RsfS